MMRISGSATTDEARLLSNQSNVISIANPTWRREFIDRTRSSRLQHALEAAGIEFIEENGGGPGVLLAANGNSPDQGGLVANAIHGRR